MKFNKFIFLALFLFPALLFSVQFENGVFILDTKVDQHFVQSYTFSKVLDSLKGIHLWKLDDQTKFYGVDSSPEYKEIIWGGGSGINDYTRVPQRSMNSPWGLACSADERYIYVSDIQANEIIKFRNDGSHINRDSSIRQLNKPSGVAVREFNKMDILYVLESGNNSMQAFVDARPLNIDASTHNLYNLANQEPMGLAVIVNDPSNYKKDQFIVSDTSGKIALYSYNRQAINVFDEPEINIGLDKMTDMRTIAPGASLYGVALDKYQHVYVLDNANAQVHILDTNLNYLFSYNLKKDGIWAPWYIDIYKPSGMVALTWGGGSDGGGMVYWVGSKIFGISTQNQYFSPASLSKNTVTVAYRLFLPSVVSASVEDYAGNTVAVIENQVYKGNSGSDTYTLSWDGKDNLGNNAASGIYKIKIKAKCYYGEFNEDIAVIPVTIVDPLIFTVSGPVPAFIDNQNGQVQLSYSVNRAEPVSLNASVQRKTGNSWVTVRTLFSSLSSLNGNLAWNGLLDNGQAAPDDLYRINLSGIDGYDLPGDTNIITAVEKGSPVDMRITKLDLGVMNPLVSKYNQNSLAFDLSQTAYLTVRITDASGNLVKLLTNQLEAASGVNSFAFNADGVLNGEYKLSVLAEQKVTGGSVLKETGLRIDTVPPVLSPSAPDNPYISPIDSPGVKDGVSYSLSADEDSTVDIQVVDSGNKVVKNMGVVSLPTGNTFATNWDGKDESGVVPPDGEYRIFNKVTDLVGNESDQILTEVIDNNKMSEDIQYQSTVTLLKQFSNNEFNFHWLRNGKKFIWFNTLQNIHYKSYQLSISPECVNGTTPSVDTQPFFITSANISGDENYLALGCSGEYLYSNVPYSKGIYSNVIYGTNSLLVYDLVNERTYKLILSACEEDWFNAFSSMRTGKNIKTYPSIVNNISNSIANLMLGYVDNSSPIISSSDIKSGMSTVNLQDGTMASVSQLSQNKTRPSYLSISPDNKNLLLGYNSSNTIIYRTDSKTAVGFAVRYGSPLWSSSHEFFSTQNLGDGTKAIVKVNADDLSAVTCGIININYTICDISYDKKNILLSDGNNLQIYEIAQKNNFLLTTFDKIDSNQNTMNPHIYCAYFSQDGNSIILSGTKNGIRGIYRVDVKKTTPKNLTAEIQYPSIGLDHLEGDVKVCGTVSDSYFDRYVLSYQQMGTPGWTFANGGKVPINQDILGNISTMGLQDGSSLIVKLDAYDKAGNMREAFTTNKVVNSASYLLSGVSVDRDYVTTNTGKIYFRLNDNATVTVKLKDSSGMERIVWNPAVPQTGFQTVDIGSQIASMADGMATYTVIASVNGKTMTSEGQLIVDKNSPVVSLDNADNSRVSGNQIIVTGNISEAYFDHYEVIMNQKNTNYYIQLPASLPGILAALPLQEDGSYSIDVVAFDKAGNSDKKSFNFTSDQTPPVCQISLPVSGDKFSKSLKVSGNINDLNFSKFDVYLNGTKVYTGNQVLNGNFTLDISSYQGPAELTILAFDTLGNITTVSRNILIDNNPPQTVVISGNKMFADVVYQTNNIFYINNAVNFQLSVSSGDSYSFVAGTYLAIDGNGYNPVQGNIHFDNGYHTVSFYSVDNLGNQENARSFSVMVDNDLPTANCVVSQPFYNDGTNIYVPANNSIYFTAADNLSGVNGIYYSLDNGNNFSSYISGVTGGLSMNYPGSKNLIYYAVDNVGNTSEQHTNQFVYDPVPPYTILNITGAYTVNNTNYYRGALSGSLVVKDFGSGVASFYYQMNNGALVNSTNLPLISGATDSLIFYSVDRLNNEENHNSNLLINDITPPVQQLLIEGISFTNRTIYVPALSSVLIRASDSQSGLKESCYSVNKANFDRNYHDFSLNSETNEINYYSMDNLGNCSVTNSETLILDSESPHTVWNLKSGKIMTLNGTNFCQAGSKFVLNSSDRLSGLSSVYLIKNGEMMQTNEFSVDVEGTNTIQFFAVDNVGNTEATNSFVLVAPIPDMTPPLISFSYSGISFLTNGYLYGNKDFAAIVTIVDPQKAGEYASGVTEVYYGLNGVWKTTNATEFALPLRAGLNSILCYAVDQMGNVSLTNNTNIVIDSLAPVTSCSYNNLGWNQEAVTLNFFAEDMPLSLASGVASTILRIGNNTHTGNVAVVSDEGMNTVSYYSIDNVSNREAEKTVSVNVDYTSPLITISGVENGHTYDSKGAQAIVMVSDKLSGVELFQEVLKKDNVVLQMITTNLAGIRQFDITNNILTAGGQYLLTVSSSDLAGNLALGSVTFNIDKTAPNTPTNVRHLFDGTNVYIEWDNVKVPDLLCYYVYKNGNYIGASTNNYIIDENVISNIFKYEIAAADMAGNVSLKSVPETVNTAQLLTFVHPSTNIYFQNKMWVRADYTDKKEKKHSRYFDFKTEETNKDNLLGAFEEHMFRHEKKMNDRDNNLKDVKLETALNDDLVPTNFVVLAEKDKFRKYLRENMDLDDLEEGNYVLRIRGNKDGWPQFEDALWYGIDNTAPVTYVVVNSNVITNTDELRKLRIPSETILGFKAFDPLVNGASSGIGATYYSIVGKKICTDWKKFDGEKISLPEGTYLITYISLDKAHFLLEDSSIPNTEGLKMMEISVGQFPVPEGGALSNQNVPVITLNGIDDYGIYQEAVSFSFTVNGAVTTKAVLDGKEIGSSARVNKSGKHHLRIEAVNESGNMTVREVIFRIDRKDND